jgi:hypothetical protein
MPAFVASVTGCRIALLCGVAFDCANRAAGFAGHTALVQ